MKNKQIVSYVQFVKYMSEINMLNEKEIVSLIESLDFTEEVETTYQNKGMKVAYRQLPIVVDGEVLVKVLLLQQADNFVIAAPENITDTYNILLEEPELIVDKNIQFSLYAEVYGFDANDKELQNIIKKAYLSSGNSLAAFELMPALEKEKEDLVDDEDSEGGLDFAGFTEIDEPFDVEPDIQINEEAYKSFKKQTNAFKLVLENLNKMQPRAITRHLRVKYIHNVLVIESDNKSIYEKLSDKPKLAKHLLSRLGESIKQYEHTQLVDTFSLNGKRYFVIAEAIGNNYWTVDGEKLEVLKENTVHVKPLQHKVIKLAKTSVRTEARKRQPRLTENNEVVFLKGK